MLGFSSVDIQTAGNSGMAGQYQYGWFRIKVGSRGYHKRYSEGHLPAVDMNEAERIRNFLMKKIKWLHKL